MSKRTLIVGAGPAGATVARMLADEGHLVDVLDKRDQIAGNCFDEHNENGILVHRYGPHYFRTNSRELLEWLSRFTDWIPGRYYVRAKIGDKLIPLPISLASMTELKERSFTPEKFEAYLESEREKFDPPLNAEQQCLSLMGRELYELIFKNYTRKQWVQLVRVNAPLLSCVILKNQLV